MEGIGSPPEGAMGYPAESLWLWRAPPPENWYRLE